MAVNIAEKGFTNPVYQAYRILHVGFIIAPIIAGVDKFFGVLTEWEKYLAPIFPELLGVSPQMFMYGVGVIEIAVGILTFFKPKIGGYFIALWLWGIIINLILLNNYYDIILRDFGLSLGALALARLSGIWDHYGKTTTG